MMKSKLLRGSLGATLHSGTQEKPSPDSYPEWLCRYYSKAQETRVKASAGGRREKG